MEQNSKTDAIEIQGITHSQSIVDQKDGACEDIINLKIKDGSWRTSGNGRQIMTAEQTVADLSQYTEIFVHKVDYSHMLGVKDIINEETHKVDHIELQYFANIQDGDVIEFLSKPQTICTLQSKDIYIQQNGHLITVIDSNNELFIYSIYRPAYEEYKKLKTNAVTKQTDRTLFPFGNIHFNLTDIEEVVKTDKDYENRHAANDFVDTHARPHKNFKKQVLLLDDGDSDNKGTSKLRHDDLISFYKEVTDKNLFTRPFMVMACVKMYDGSLIHFTMPTLLYPFNRFHNNYIYKTNMLDDYCYGYLTSYDWTAKAQPIKSCYSGNTVFDILKTEKDKNADSYCYNGYECNYTVDYAKKLFESSKKADGTYDDAIHDLTEPSQITETATAYMCTPIRYETTSELMDSRWEQLFAQNAILYTNYLKYGGGEESNRFGCYIHSLTNITPAFTSGVLFDATVIQSGQNIWADLYTYNHDIFIVNIDGIHDYDLKGFWWQYCLKGSKIQLNISDELIEFLENNTDLVQGISLFVTPQQDIYYQKTSEDSTYEHLSKIIYTHFFIPEAFPFEIYGDSQKYKKKRTHVDSNGDNDLQGGASLYFCALAPVWKSSEDILSGIKTSQFYHLVDYNTKELKKIKKNGGAVDLTAEEYDGLLTAIQIGEGYPLSNYEYTNDRNIYMPRVQYAYNGRLHIANYKKIQFGGFPIDMFNFNNHFVLKTETESSFFPSTNNGEKIIHNAKDYKKDITDNGNTIANFISGVGASEQQNNQYRTLSADEIKEITDSSHLIDTLLQGKRYRLYFDSLPTTDDPLCIGALQHDPTNEIPYIIIRVYFEDTEKLNIGTQVTTYVIAKPDITKEGEAAYIEDLDSMISYPDRTAVKMELYFTFDIKDNKVYYAKRTYELKEYDYFNMAYHITDDLLFHRLPSTYDTDKDGNPITATIEEYKSFATQHGAEEEVPNGLKVSSTNNPTTFLEENTYKVGNGKILALCANTVAVNTGQTGNAPLLVFCTDGVYALTVDETGQICYTTSTILARDVCNNGKSVTPIDNGIVFTTDRGLMCVNGKHQIEEIGEIAEGDVLDFTPKKDEKGENVFAQRSYKIMYSALTKQPLANISEKNANPLPFLTFLKDTIINYNHNEKELWLSIPTLNDDNKTFKYPYTFVLSNGMWSRRTFSALEYINNFPTSYRKDADGKLYKCDEQEGTKKDEQKAGVSEASNSFFLLTQPIKMGTLGLKQAYRFVARGEFITLPNTKLGLYIFGSYDSKQWGIIGGNEKEYTNELHPLNSIGCRVEHTDMRFYRILLCGQLHGKSRFNFFEISADPSQLNTRLR